ncbi:PREDICTED: transcription factor-like 5 protein isoform X3 [Chinchilla lanigera]|uniref:transcription factor-like 5 protein isoform X3 n=1 Tax=Chinchilla lanigera TaxID=34839 RepID=UPI0006960E4A|nr:PREDICTED: transcription factor-like 5 protein isoform X3 [Chinchilla lanigera]
METGREAHAAEALGPPRASLQGPLVPRAEGVAGLMQPAGAVASALRSGGAGAGAGAAGALSSAPPVYPVLCPPLAADAPCLGHVDFQELRMMLLGEAGAAEKTPGGADGARARTDGAAKEGAGAAGPEGAPEARAKPAVRVRLEDRFNSIPAEPPVAPRGPEAPEPGVALNNLVTLIRHPSELMNVPLHQQQNKCTTLVKNKTAAAATALQFTYPLFTSACSTGGNSNISQTQSSSNSCSVLEAAKHQDIGLPRAFSFCYQQEIESTKQTLEEALCKQAINKRNRSRIRQLDTSIERRALGEIQNVGEGSTATQGAWQSSESSQSNLGEQTQSGPQGGRSQRRERHNRMERDRRRRIRICCDELNLLVPFCNAETDKATTLQWTTAFLKYIQERHGDSLKKQGICSRHGVPWIRQSPCQHGRKQPAMNSEQGGVLWILPRGGNAAVGQCGDRRRLCLEWSLKPSGRSSNAEKEPASQNVESCSSMGPWAGAPHSMNRRGLCLQWCHWGWSTR